MCWSRATVADCIAIMSLPEDERRVVVAHLHRNEEQSRSETYTYHGCATKGCRETVRVVRAATNNPNLCTTCYLARGSHGA